MGPSPDQMALYRIARKLVDMANVDTRLDPWDVQILGILELQGYVRKIGVSWVMCQDAVDFCYPHLEPDNLPSTEVEIIEVLEQDIPF